MKKKKKRTQELASKYIPLNLTHKHFQHYQFSHIKNSRNKLKSSTTAIHSFIYLSTTSLLLITHTSPRTQYLQLPELPHPIRLNISMFIAEQNSSSRVSITQPSQPMNHPSIDSCVKPPIPKDGLSFLFCNFHKLPLNPDQKQAIQFNSAQL